MASPISRLAIILSANTQGYTSDVEDAGDATESFGDRALKAFGAVTSFVGDKFQAAVVSAVRTFKGLVDQQFQFLDNLAKMSDRTGIAVRDMQSLELASRLAGLSLTEVETAVRTMQKRIAGESSLEGSTSGTTAGGFLKSLGLTGDDPQRELFAVLDALDAIDNKARRTQIATELFGARTGQRLLTLNLATFRLAATDIERVGAGLNRLDVAKVEAFNDSWERLTNVFSLLAQQVTVALAEPLETVASEIREGLIQLLPVIVDQVKEWGDALAVVASRLRGLADGVQIFGAVETLLAPGAASTAARFGREGESQLDRALFSSSSEGNVLVALDSLRRRVNDEDNRFINRQLGTSENTRLGGILGAAAGGSLARGVSSIPAGAALDAATGFFGDISSAAGRGIYRGASLGLVGRSLAGPLGGLDRSISGALSSGLSGVTSLAGSLLGQGLENASLARASRLGALADQTRAFNVAAVDVRTAAGASLAAGDPTSQIRERLLNEEAKARRKAAQQRTKANEFLKGIEKAIRNPRTILTFG